MSMSSRLADLAWPQIDARACAGHLLCLPFGSCEQHGPHLPPTTDTDIAVGIADLLAQRRDDVLLAPPITVGASGEHDGFAGTLSVGLAVTESVLLELGRSAMGPFSRLLVISTHGGNVQPVRAAVAVLRAEGRDVRGWGPNFDGDAHAGHTETSLMRHLRPDVVDMGQAQVGDVRPLAQMLPQLRQAGVKGVVANGVLGDPRGATAAHGAALLALAGHDLDRALKDWWP